MRLSGAGARNERELELLLEIGIRGNESLVVPAIVDKSFA